jgi:hypothetical protein
VSTVERACLLAMINFSFSFDNIIQNFVKAYHGALARDGEIDYTP